MGGWGRNTITSIYVPCSCLVVLHDDNHVLSRPRRNKQLHFDFDFLKSLSHHSSLKH